MLAMNDVSAWVGLFDHFNLESITNVDRNTLQSHEASPLDRFLVSLIKSDLTLRIGYANVNNAMLFRPVESEDDCWHGQYHDEQSVGDSARRGADARWLIVGGWSRWFCLVMSSAEHHQYNNDDNSGEEKFG